MTEYKEKPTMYKSEYKAPITMWFDDDHIKYTERLLENAVYEAVVKVGINVDKTALMEALTQDKRRYELGEWEMFSLVTSVYHGKQYYFLQPDGTVYSRESGRSLSKVDAYDEFLRNISAY